MKIVLTGLFLLCLVGLSVVSGAMISVVPNPNQTASQIANCYASDGEAVTMNLILDEAKDGLSGYKISIGFSKGNIARIMSVSLPEWTNTTKNIEGVLPGQKVTISAADLNEKVKKGAVNVPLCSLNVTGLNPGTTSLDIQVTEMTNDYGKPITITSGPDTQINVYSVPPLESSLGAPRDMDHNGLLDDFNGNHAIDIDDIVVFFHAWSVGTTNGLSVVPFDYNANGRIDVNDIVVFFERYWT